MKTVVKSVILLIALNSYSWINPQKAFAQTYVSFQVFYDELSPYGMWINNPDYGYVWVPNVSPGFTPYGTNGYWVYTDIGWTWVSDYPWGWAPFHYGRWFYDPFYGPMWVPGSEWGPGWVTWRRSEGYYGWAPIEPGISISVAYSDGYHVPHDRWRFVRDRDFGRTNINNYYINTTNNTTIINNSTVINNIQVDKSRNAKYNSGPDRNEVQKQSGSRIAPVVVKENNKPGQNLRDGQLEIYRPRVDNKASAGNKPAPVKVEERKEVKPAKEKNSEIQPHNDIRQEKPEPSQQRNIQPNKEQPIQHKEGGQPEKQQPQPPPVDHPEIKQQPKQQHNEQPKQQNNEEPKQQHNEQPNNVKSPQRDQIAEPPNKPPQEKIDQPNQPQPSQPKQSDHENKKKHMEQQPKQSPDKKDEKKPD